MGKHASGKWGRDIGQHGWTPGRPTSAWCYLCDAPHRYASCPLTAAEKHAAGLARQAGRQAPLRMNAARASLRAVRR